MSENENNNNNNHEPPQVVSPKWGISIGLVVLLVGGAIGCIGFAYDLGQKYARLDSHVADLTTNVRDIKDLLSEALTGIRAEISELRRDNANLRERVSRLEAKSPK